MHWLKSALSHKPFLWTITLPSKIPSQKHKHQQGECFRSHSKHVEQATHKFVGGVSNRALLLVPLSTHCFMALAPFNFSSFFFFLPYLPPDNTDREAWTEEAGEKVLFPIIIMENLVSYPITLDLSIWNAEGQIRSRSRMEFLPLVSFPKYEISACQITGKL